jgi:uncharacterized protein (TIGR02172 family)
MAKGMNMPELSPISAPIASGRTAEIYAWEDGYILKLYREWCPSHWIEHEERVARAIVTAGIPTPAVREIVEVNGRRGIVYERVQGVSMLQDLNTRPWMILRHARTLADLQAQFQKLTLPGLFSYREGLKHTISRAPHLGDDLREKALSLLETLPDEKTLCHGDFHPGNILLSPHGPVTIDWMTASNGSPWADVARTSMILSVGAKAAGKQVHPLIRMMISLYNRTYLNHYRSLNPDHHETLKRWMPVIAAARLDEQIEPEREALIRMVRDGLGMIEI